MKELPLNRTKQVRAYSHEEAKIISIQVEPGPWIRAPPKPALLTFKCAFEFHGDLVKMQVLIFRGGNGV